jgi:hypothetical protein
MLQRPPKADRRRSAASARQARYRARSRNGRVVVSVEVDERLLDLLVRLRWLREAAAGDRAAIGRALQAMLRDAAR